MTGSPEGPGGRGLPRVRLLHKMAERRYNVSESKMVAQMAATPGVKAEIMVIVNSADNERGPQ